MISPKCFLLAVTIISTTCYCLSIERQSKRCGKGEYLAPDGRCHGCPRNFFTDREDHVNPSCFPCTKPGAIHNALETEECSSQHDTKVIKCKKRFYLKKTYDHRYECLPCPQDDCRSIPECCSFNESTTATVGQTSTELGSQGPLLTTFGVSPGWADSTPEPERNQTQSNVFSCDYICVNSSGQVNMVNMTCQRTVRSVIVLVPCQDCQTNINGHRSFKACPEEDEKTSAALIAGISVICTAVIIAGVVITVWCCWKKRNFNYRQVIKISDTKIEIDNKTKEININV